jgi:hypothetical protein
MHRREFLWSIGGTLAGGAAAMSKLGAMAPALAGNDPVTPDVVRFGPDMEPVVRWIESTPRERILEAAVDALRAGLSYRRFLGGLFLAGIRNIRPRPVGFKFHAVMVIESAHQLSLDAPPPDRLVPLFWALDNFKASQEADVREGDWALPAVKESALPPAGKARRAFIEAMDRWDGEAADAAIAALCRAEQPSEVIETLWPLGARDWENIGHKIIFTAHAARTLETIGWQHAEPVLRSLVHGLLTGGPDDSSAPYAENREIAARARPDWAHGRRDPAAAVALLETLRQGSARDAATAAAGALEKGIAPASLWDGILLAAGELCLRQPGIVALHAVTAANSLHHAYRASAHAPTRLLTLLQAASWTTLYRDAIRARQGGLPDTPRIDRLEPDGAPASPEEIFEKLDEDPVASARRVLAHPEWVSDPAPFTSTARGLIFRKGTDSHDYKFAAAAFEEVARATPDWRGRILAASVTNLKSIRDPDSKLIERARAALASY